MSKSGNATSAASGKKYESVGRNAWVATMMFPLEFTHFVSLAAGSFIHVSVNRRP